MAVDGGNDPQGVSLLRLATGDRHHACNIYLSKKSFAWHRYEESNPNLRVWKPLFYH